MKLNRQEPAMASEPFTTQRGTSQQASQQGSPNSINQRLSYATSRAEVLFGCYRKGDANDPDRYVSAIAAVLTLYDFELMREVTDPRTGIMTTEKFASFMPNAGELKVYCEAAAARKDRLQKLGDLPRPDFTRAQLPKPAPAPGDKATVFVPASNSNYAALLEWSKTADVRLFKFEARPGIWVSYDTWENRRIATRPRAEPETPRLELSAEAKRVMASIDAERNRDLPVDQGAREAVG
jgi:hypothetical protein